MLNKRTKKILADDNEIIYINNIIHFNSFLLLVFKYGLII
jgi:hypothetical protein